MPTRIDTTPFWSANANLPRFDKLQRNEKADVVIVGAGITGLTAAYQLAAAGASVVVLERGRLAGVDTGHTSAHLTMVTDTRLSELVGSFGHDHARAVWDAGLAAISVVDETIEAEKIDCSFAWVPGYLHAAADASASDVSALEEEAALAVELGFDAEFVTDVPLANVAGIRFENQARFHPRRYLAGLSKAIVRKGGRIYEESEVKEFVAEPRAVKANGHTVTCGFTVIATNNPLVGSSDMKDASRFQTKLALYSSYVIAARTAATDLPDVLLWDTGRPYHYYRWQPGQNDESGVAEGRIVFGGADHKTGQVTDTAACYAKVEADLRKLVPDAEITHQWSGQVIETNDGLPFIGEHATREFIGTGYCGNGLTFGTLAGLMAADAFLNQRNPWTDLLSVNRSIVRGGLWDYLKENKDYPYYKVRDLFAGVESRGLRAVKRGEGQLVAYKGKTVAAYRHDNGKLSLRAAECSHMGCLVAWNSAERSWDCPCHGSRFTPAGKVISGPAEAPLDPVVRHMRQE